MIFQRYRSATLYNKSVFEFLIVCEAVLLTVSLADFIQGLIDSTGSAIGMLYTFLAFPVVAYAFHKLLAYKDLMLIKQGIKLIKNENGVESFCIIVLELVESREQPESRIMLEGILKHHIKYSTKQADLDLCNVILADNLKDEETPAKSKRWYLFVLIIVNEGLEKF